MTNIVRLISAHIDSMSVYSQCARFFLCRTQSTMLGMRPFMIQWLWHGIRLVFLVT